MAIPLLTKEGILPAGTYSCSLQEISRVYAYNDRRREICNGLAAYLKQAAVIPDVDTVSIDGGFITDKVFPKDVDIVLVLPSGIARRNAWLSFPHLFDRPKVKERYLVDVFTAIATVGAPFDDFREFFQQMRPEEALARRLPVGARKGILEVSIR